MAQTVHFYLLLEYNQESYTQAFEGVGFSHDQMQNLTPLGSQQCLNLWFLRRKMCCLTHPCNKFSPISTGHGARADHPEVNQREDLKEL